MSYPPTLIASLKNYLPSSLPERLLPLLKTIEFPSNLISEVLSLIHFLMQTPQIAEDVESIECFIFPLENLK